MFLFDRIPRATTRNGSISPTVKNTYNILRSFADIHTNIAVVYVDTIAKHANRTTRTIRAHIRQLIALGLIARYFRKSTRNPKMNLANAFTILPVEAISKNSDRHSVYAGSDLDKVQKISGGTEENFTQNMGEILERDKNLTLKREAELPKYYESSENPENQNPAITQIPPAKSQKREKPKTPNQGGNYDLSRVPDVLRPTARYLLMRTGRNAFEPDEYRIMRELLQHHYPNRILREIDKAIEHHKSVGKNLKCINFYYLGSALGYQHSLKPKTDRADRNEYAQKAAHETKAIQETMPEVSAQILPVDVAEAVISEYTSAEKKQDGVPAALEELYEKIQAKEKELNDEYVESLPKTENGTPDWEMLGVDDVGVPMLPQISIEDYLRLKFPEAEEEELRTDRMNNRELRDLKDAVRTDRICASCNHDGDGYCPLTKNGKRPSGKSVVMLKNHRLAMGFTPCMRCKHDKGKIDPEIEKRVKNSGLSASQANQTFGSYVHKGMSAEVASAKAQAIITAKNNTSLILAGKPGTGKTHLATAIALEVMRGGKQALFRTVPDLLDELRQAEWGHTDFHGLMQKFRDVPCLVLDDLGKEKTTDKGMEYLYKIIDYRYRNGLQTIITTNALDMSGLVNQFNTGKIEPLISRILENGEWVTIRNADNHRLSVS